MPGSNDLSSVIAALQEGQPQAMAELYELYAHPLQRYCYVRLGDRETAQDCVQDVFVCLWKGIQTFEYRGDLSFMAWVYTIANNTLVSYIRRRDRRPQVPLTADLQLIDQTSRDTPRAICERLALREALRQLTIEQQQVIALKYFVGLSNLEIAAVINRSEGAVKALQFRAIISLQRILSSDAIQTELGPSVGPPMLRPA